MILQLWKTIEILEKAWDILLKYFNSQYIVEYKGEWTMDPVTSADFESSEYIIEALKKEYPGVDVLSEESAWVEIDYSRTVWIVDPLDWTRDFVKGSEEFWIILWKVIDWVLVEGYVYSPVNWKLQFALKGQGAYVFHNDELRGLQVSKETNLRDFIFRGSTSKEEISKLAFLQEKLNFKWRDSSWNSVSRLGAIAEGDNSFYLSTAWRWHKWDTSWSQLIIEEAGWKVTDIQWNPLDYTQESTNWPSVLVTNWLIHDEIIQAYQEDMWE